MKAAITLAAMGLIALPGIAAAQSCLGVEARVNAQTSSLVAGVGSSIVGVQSTLVAQEIAERARLLSAIKVLTAQSAVGSDQLSNGMQSAGQAFVATMAAQQQRQAVADAIHRYQSTGYAPCMSNARAKDLYSAIQAAPQQQKQIGSRVRAQPGQYADPADWANDVKSGDAPDGGSLYAGDGQAAAKFINTVVGPPDAPSTAPTNQAAADLAKLQKTGRDADRSLTTAVLSGIAADYDASGPIAKARDLSKHWQGDDGGATWAAGVAGQHERGVLQDAVRMEAANLAQIALQLKNGARTEAAAAAVLLAMVNARIDNLTRRIDQGPLARGSDQ